MTDVHYPQHTEIMPPTIIVDVQTISEPMQNAIIKVSSFRVLFYKIRVIILAIDQIYYRLCGEDTAYYT